MKKILSVIALVLIIMIGWLGHNVIRTKLLENQEKIEQLGDLITFHWEGFQYQKDGVSIVFKHPDYVHVCDPAPRINEFIRGFELFIRGTCEEGRKNMDPAPITIAIQDNSFKGTTPKEIFFNEFPEADRSDKELHSFKLDKFEAFGGAINHHTEGPWITKSADYGAIAMKGPYVITIHAYNYDVVADNTQSGYKAVLDSMLNTFYFDTVNYWKE